MSITIPRPYTSMTKQEIDLLAVDISNDILRFEPLQEILQNNYLNDMCKDQYLKYVFKIIHFKNMTDILTWCWTTPDSKKNLLKAYRSIKETFDETGIVVPFCIAIPFHDKYYFYRIFLDKRVVFLKRAITDNDDELYYC